MSGAKHHDYHLVNPSVWPLIGSARRAGDVLRPRDVHARRLISAARANGCSASASWASSPPSSAGGRTSSTKPIAGDHTPVVQLHLRYGMILFIASEVMFFVGWFWAWFDFSLFPVPIEYADGAVTSLFGQDGAAAITMWPPKGIEVIDAFSLPLAQHADPALLGHHDHLGAPRADPRRPRRPEKGPVGDDHPRCVFSIDPGL